MSLKIASSKLTGTPDSSGWSQVHEFTPQEEEKIKSRGHLIAVLATAKNEEGTNDIVVGRECLTRLHEEYYGNLEKGAFNALKDAVQKVTGEFEESLGPLEIAAGAFLGDVTYTAAINGAQVAIYRNGMFAKIIESRSGDAISASGYPQTNDLLILGTKNFFSEIAVGSIRAALERGNPESAIELLAPLAHSSNLSGRIGAAVVKFTDEKGLAIDNVFEEKTGDHPQVEVETKRDNKLTLALKSVPGRLIKFLPAKKVYVKFPKNEEGYKSNKKVTFSVGLILLILLLVSIGFGIKQKKLKDYKASYKEELTKGSHSFDEAISLSEVDPSKARELFADARKITTELIEKGIKDDDLANLQLKIKENEGPILGEYREDSEPFIDLTLLTDGFSGQKLTYSEGELFVLDSISKKVVNIILESKKSKVFAGPSKLGSVKDIASYVDRLFTLEDDGIYEITDSRKKVIDKDWGENVSIYAYGANIYILDKENSKILRFAGIEKGFSSKQEWLSPGVVGDFSDVGYWTIDGSIWMLTGNSKVLRYSLGNKVNFEIKGSPIELKDQGYIYTDGEAKYIYIMLPTQKTVVVLNKEGDYQFQYISDKISDARGFIVSENDKKIIILTGDKLYSLGLKTP